jgi:glyoxalase/bleomycin resistance protein/dioxygenase superfamily protein
LLDLDSIVEDLPAGKAFFLDLGLELRGEGKWLDQIVGLNDVKIAFLFLRMPDGQTNLELIKYYRPSGERDVQQPLANTLGIRHIAFVVKDIEAMVAKLKKRRSLLKSLCRADHISQNE